MKIFKYDESQGEHVNLLNVKIGLKNASGLGLKWQWVKSDGEESATVRSDQGTRGRRRRRRRNGGGKGSRF